MRWFPAILMALLAVSACSKKDSEPTAKAPVEVTVQRIEPRDTPVTSSYDGQTQSSRQVQIYARVNGFLDRRVYTEGSLVKEGQVLFLQDPKPFQAQLDAAKGALAAQRARLTTAQQNLARVKPLVAQNALSQKDLDDAIGNEQAAVAAVETARANVETAQLNLGYTTIRSPLTGLSSFAKVQDGAYIGSENSLLTYVEQVDPIYVNFSLSENTILSINDQRKKGLLVPPKNDDYQVEVTLANGKVYSQTGRITFANADFNQQTGTYLLRATLPNPEGELRSGQFVRVDIKGAIRPQAVLVPQQAVLQGAKGHFVVVVGKDSKAEIRPVQVGNWYGDQWFINEGLKAGDLVVVDGMVRLAPGVPVKYSEAGVAANASAAKH